MLNRFVISILHNSLAQTPTNNAMVMPGAPWLRETEHPAAMIASVE
jgi:hypothetical protein